MDSSKNCISILNLDFRSEIENNFYHSLNKPDMWDNIFLKSVKNGEDLSTNIENYASNGIVNLRILMRLFVTKFQYTYTLFTQDESIEDINILKWYGALICYLSNCYDYEQQKALTQLNEQEQLNFFYSDKINKSLDTLIQKHKNEISSLLKRSNIDIKSESHISKLVRDLIALPYIFKIYLKTENDILTDLNHLIKEIVTISNNEFLSLIISNNDYFFIKKIIHTIAIFNLFIGIINLNGSNKSYGLYQCIFEKQSGNILYSIPYQDKSFLIRGASALVVGGKNINNVEIIDKDSILIEFKSGHYYNDTLVTQTAFNSALAINQFVKDSLIPFKKIISIENNKSNFLKRILLEKTFDNLEFSQIVKEQINHLNTFNPESFIVVPPLNLASKNEKKLYLSSNSEELTQELQCLITEKIKKISGKKTLPLPKNAFENAKIIELLVGETLFNDGDYSLFVYFPFDEGLEGFNQKDQITFKSIPWTPIGQIGVIQNEKRTATIVAKKNVKLLVIPADIYLQFWHIYYTIDEIRTLLHERKKLLQEIY